MNRDDAAPPCKNRTGIAIHAEACCIMDLPGAIGKRSHRCMDRATEFINDYVSNCVR
jgi:hypothetical protein